MPSLSYTPDLGFVGQDVFTYEITNPDGATAQATVTVDVASDTFTVVDDSLSAFVGQAVSYQLAANDEFVGLTPTFGVIGSLPEGITISSDGLVTGTFETETTGSVSIVVTLTNGSTAGSTFTWSARMPTELDPWMAPIYVPDAQDTDADRIRQALSDIQEWVTDFPATAAELKDLGDAYEQ